MLRTHGQPGDQPPPVWGVHGMKPEARPGQVDFGPAPEAGMMSDSVFEPWDERSAAFLAELGLSVCRTLGSPKPMRRYVPGRNRSRIKRVKRSCSLVTTGRMV